jgi:hypothetical protein
MMDSARTNVQKQIIQEGKMKTHKSLIVVGIMALTILVTLALFTGLTQAQGSGPAADTTPQGVAMGAPGTIPIQGRLTSASGSPLSGTYTVMYRLYESNDINATAVCTDTDSVSVANGLFNGKIEGCQYDVTGQILWLGIKVGSDEEMTPRQIIYPVPYALSLVPGAVISDTYTNNAIVHLENWGTNGRALRAYAMSTSGANYGVVGVSRSPDGYGGYFYDEEGGVGVYGKGSPGVLGRAGLLGAGVKGEGNPLAFGGVFTNTLGGTALRAESDGTALQLAGSGRIESTAQSYLWISGNGVRPYLQNDSTVIDMDTVGGAKITRGATAGNKNVMLPLTIPGTLYGQNVKISAVDIYWVGDTTFEGITAVLLRRQTGVCESATCYASIINDHPVGYTCEDSVYPSGCTRHYEPTSNNTLSSSSGILYLTLELTFSSDTAWIKIGGVRLTLDHD